jgi:hypothetical protein
MAKKAYTWDETLAVERRGEAILDAIFGRDYIIVRATKWHQKQKIDRFHIHRRDGMKMFRIDYKVDEVAGHTGNLALEDVSVRRHGKRIARGWVHETIAHLVVFYVPAHDTAYVLRIDQLRERWPDIQAGFHLKTTSTTRFDDSYETEFYPVPIGWLRNNKLINQELPAVGAQLRLRLT